jgi:hypothetical protein
MIVDDKWASIGEDRGDSPSIEVMSVLGVPTESSMEVLYQWKTGSFKTFSGDHVLER